MLTNWNLSDRFNQPSAAPLIPPCCSSVCNRILWSVVSNAALRSNRTSIETSPLSDAMKRSFLSRFTVLFLWRDGF